MLEKKRAVINSAIKNVTRVIGYFSRLYNQRVLTSVRDRGENISIGRWVRIENPQCVRIDDGAVLNDGCWLSVLTENRERNKPSVTLSPELTIGARTYVGRFGTIACIAKVSIGQDVLISDRVFIGDSAHGYERTDLPIHEQYMVSRGAVEIGDGTWIGIGVSVLGNVKIGRNCVIGAGSVVTKDIPDYCVAAGVPAKILHRINA